MAQEAAWIERLAEHIVEEVVAAAGYIAWDGLQAAAAAADRSWLVAVTGTDAHRLCMQYCWRKRMDREEVASSGCMSGYTAWKEQGVAVEAAGCRRDAFVPRTHTTRPPFLEAGQRLECSDSWA